MSAQLIDDVSELLRQVAAEVVLPGFRSLNHTDIREKTPGEVVTVIDENAERQLAAALTALRRGSRVVGEEGAATDPTILYGLDQGEVWLVDPLDGTANFIAGNPDFAVMVALLRSGETVASWILAPISGELTVAEHGAGAYRNGEKLRVPAGKVTPQALRGIVKTGFLPPQLRERVKAQSALLPGASNGSGSAGIEYPLIARGQQHFALYWRMLPWDHAPGTLLVTESGGHVAHCDGRSYRAAEKRGGLIAAASREAWHQAHATLLGDDFPLVEATP